MGEENLKVSMFDQLRNLTMVEKDMPQVKSNEVLIKVIAAGICGSDVHAYIEGK